MKATTCEMRRALVLTTFTVLLAAGCSSTASLRPTSATGVIGSPGYYPTTMDVLFQIAREATSDLGLAIVEAASDQSYFIAQRGVRTLDWGILVGVYFAATIDGVTLVVIRTEPKFPANIAAKNLASALHGDIRNKLKARLGRESNGS